MNSDIDLMDIRKRIIKYWWIIIITGLVGAAFSLVVSVFNVPIYETHASIKFGYDFDGITARNISQSRLDYMESKSSLVIIDSSIINQVIQSVNSGSIDLTSESFSLQRRVSLWDLVVRSRNPQAAADAANLWQNLAIQHLDQVRSHGIEAYALSLEVDALNNCTKLNTQNDLCSSIRNLPDLSEKISDLTNQMDLETKSSLGITIANLFEPGDKAQIPSTPTINNRNLMVFTGTLIGLLLGYLILNLRWLKIS